MSRRRAPESSVDSPLWPAVEEWLAHLGVERGLSANTTSAYRRDLVAWVEHLDAAGRTSWPSVQGADVRQHLADLTRELAVAPVRFIKTIGDEVMLVSPEPAPLLETLLHLVDATEGEDDFPRLRAGVATGMAVSREGDWFGSPVNLAARVTGAARPGTVLVAESSREAIGEDDRFTWSFAGAKRLKGIKDEVKLFRARYGPG